MRRVRDPVIKVLEDKTGSLHFRLKLHFLDLFNQFVRRDDPNSIIVIKFVPIIRTKNAFFIICAEIIKSVTIVRGNAINI